MPPQVFFAGTAAEVAHQVQPLQERMPVEQIEPDDLVNRARPGDLAIFFSEHFDRFRQAISELKQRQVATLYLVDGILEWRNSWLNRVDEPACPWTMRPVLAHKVGCIGYQQARVLAGWGNAAKLEIVGIPRLDRLAPAVLQTTARNSLPNDTGVWRLLVITAKCPGFTPEQIQTTFESLVELKKFCDYTERIGGRRLEVQWRLTADFAQRLGVDNHLQDLSGSEIARQIAAVDAVVTTPSTSMLESMLHQRPTALLDFHGVPQWSPAVWSLSHSSQFSRVFAEMANPTALQWAWQRQLLRDQLFLAEPATDRLEQLVRGMLDHSQLCLSKSLPLEFPAQMLRPPLAEPLEFQMAALFPEYSEFRNADLMELQSQLAHSRREIKHLQSQIGQLQLELGQAHAIFDEIHSHPLAGPIVRARQRVVDWWNALGKRREALTK